MRIFVDRRLEFPRIDALLAEMSINLEHPFEPRHSWSSDPSDAERAFFLIVAASTSES